MAKLRASSNALGDARFMASAVVPRGANGIIGSGNNIAFGAVGTRFLLSGDSERTAGKLALSYSGLSFALGVLCLLEAGELQRDTLSRFNSKGSLMCFTSGLRAESHSSSWINW